MPQFSQISLNPSAASTRRALRTAAETEPAWKAPSLAAVSESVPGSSHIHSEDANILLVFLSVLAISEKIPLDLLFRGATPRRRWNVYGEIEEVDAVPAGLAPELCSLLSDIPRLDNAFHELGLSTAVSKKSDQTYILDEAVASRIRERLSTENLSFFNCQALIVAYRAIPWKYLEAATPNTKLFLPHLKYALQAFNDRSGYLPTSTRADLVLTLVEASRFPNMAWKRFAVDQAEIAARDLEDWYIHSSVAQSRCFLSRISGNMDQAVNSLGDLSQGRISTTIDKRMHSAVGQATIQRSLNCIQVEDLSTAKRLLEDWSSLGQDPSSLERVVIFRKDMILGRILRFQGVFKESLTHLQRARTTAEQPKDLIFDEDFRDLTCDLADTLRELDDPASAEHHLRAEIARRDQYGASSPGRSLLELSLAETLFAQRRFKEAEELCLKVQSRLGLLKFEQLRLHITLAKIRHVNSDDEGASPHWAKAMVAISKFPNESGATRIIVKSVCDILSRQTVSVPDNGLLDQSLETLNSLDKLEKPWGVRCWIAGMRHWAEYLQSGDRSLRTRL
ncbi:hypothetical protein BGZ63DRAFT_368306 [Mariannaea sp. PMI_226]|nr:hypothetical protein BGZ63DRAFT_368306 [Mariannaea sp. PMI_226]